MLIEFDKLDDTVLENFYGGDGCLRAKMHIDDHGKIMRAKLAPGSSSGMHTHNGSGEIIYVISGSCKILYDDREERLYEGCCHYCPEGHSHSMINDTDDDLIFFAVVPMYGNPA